MLQLVSDLDEQCPRTFVTFRGKHNVWREIIRSLHNKEFHNLYYLPNIIRIIKSRWIRWAGVVESMVDKRIADMILVVKLEI
jgi:hypothetical protein